jgi:CO/xanthine dehydrogenase FAD-binding subunit
MYLREKKDIISYITSEKTYSLMGGCTSVASLPPACLIARTFPFDDLRLIERHERFIDYGAAVTLSEILDESKRRLSTVFYDAVESIATPFIRNIATIGGNLCLPREGGTLFPVLLALKANLCIPRKTGETMVDMEKFHALPPGTYLVKIRIPVDEWDIEIFRHIGPRSLPRGDHGVFVFLGKVQQYTLTDLRIAYSRRGAFRSRELENQLVGVKLPLTPNKRTEVLTFAKSQGIPFMDLLELGLENIS